LFVIFSDWATPLNPKAHCFVAAPEAHRARADPVVLGAATYDGANLHTKLEQWHTQFRAWFSPAALTSTASPTAAAFLATTPIFMRFITPPAAAAVSAKDRKRKAAEGPDDPATVIAKAAETTPEGNRHLHHRYHGCSRSAPSDVDSRSFTTK
jgi:hypothetical protein